jgi:hypothetical protein
VKEGRVASGKIGDSHLTKRVCSIERSVLLRARVLSSLTSATQYLQGLNRITIAVVKSIMKSGVAVGNGRRKRNAAICL